MQSRAVLSVVVMCFAGCRAVTELDPSTGRPIGAIEDSAPADAYQSPRRDAEPGEAGPPDAAVTDAVDASTTGGVDEQVCNACEAASCRNVDGLDLYAACFLVTDPATGGAGAGKPKSELCKAVLHCARITGCAITDPQPCYCGEGVSDLSCLAGQAVGKCKAEIEAAAESASAAVIAERLADPSYASGAAFNLLRYCESPICGASCLGPPPPDAGVGQPDAKIATPDAKIAIPDAAVPLPDAAPITCADLDQDGTPDCDQTLLQNARFDHDLSSWVADFGAAESWDGLHDGLGAAASGAIAVTNTIVIATTGTTMTGASQCVPATPGASYVVAAQAFIPTLQGPGSAGVNVQFFPAAGCAGTITGVWISDLVDGTGAWAPVSGTLAVPAGSASMRVRLVVVKSFSAPALKARFDNVLLRKK